MDNDGYDRIVFKVTGKAFTKIARDWVLEGVDGEKLSRW